MITTTAVPAIQACIRAQLHHPERHGGAGIGMAVTARAYKWIYKGSQFFRRNLL